MKLGCLHAGQTCTITAVGGEGALRRRLLDMGLTPSTTLCIRKLAPMGDPIQMTLRGYELTLRKADADRIEVEPQAAQCPPCPDAPAASAGRGFGWRRRARKQREEQDSVGGK